MHVLRPNTDEPPANSVQEIEIRGGQAPQYALFPCVVSQVARLSRLSRPLSHRSMFCASHRTVVKADAKSWVTVPADHIPPVREAGGRYGDTTLRLAGGIWAIKRVTV